MSNQDERVALCALNRIFGYHPRLALELIAHCGSAREVFSGGPKEVPGHPELASQLVPEALDWACAELSRTEAGGFRFLGLHDEDYPVALKECPDPPLGLYLNGSSSATEIFGLRPMIAVVGTRDLSPYGKTWCRKLVEGLAASRVQPCIVSGLALGTDGVAHQTALSCGLPTVGVMATGIERVYPWQHEKLAMEIVQTPGSGLITDYPIGSSPVALNFMRRNRIIAGLVLAVIVVESKTKGGSLMTARYAVEYGRDVYALPGRADDVRSAGCNSLIRTQMAEIITTAEDLAARLGLGAPARGAGASWRHSAPVSQEGDGLARALRQKYGEPSLPLDVGLALRESRGATIEELSASLQKPFADVLSAVGLLEADGYLTTDLLRRCSLSPPWD